MIWFDYFYLLFAPLVLILSFVLNKKYKVYAKSVLAVINVLLIFHSIYIIRQFVAFYQLAVQLNVPLHTNQPIEIGWQQIKDWLIILLPFLFLVKPLMANRWLSVGLIFLLKYNFWVYNFTHLSSPQSWYVDTYLPYNFPLYLIHYIAWFCTIFSFLWLIKYLPKKLIATNDGFQIH
jgi:hypothetical protein